MKIVLRVGVEPTTPALKERCSELSLVTTDELTEEELVCQKDALLFQSPLLYTYWAMGATFTLTPMSIDAQALNVMFSFYVLY